MQETKQRIIKLLNSNGPMATGELSAILGISSTAVRRHLTTLEAQDVVCFKTEQRGMGRPSFVYELLDSRPALFRQSFSDFVNSVLKELKQWDQDGEPDELIDRHQSRRHEQYKKLTEGETLTDRVACLARLMESEGRITTWQQLRDNRFILREHNCAYDRLNGKSEYACQCEVSLLRATLKANVRRVGHIPDGDVACVYEIEDSHNSKVAEVLGLR
jgi:predicted ArsR family transcriptional regulator